MTVQNPKVTAAVQSLPVFIRQGDILGLQVTFKARQDVGEFVDKLISIALPRLRDFQGINPKGFDGHGNYTLG